MTDLTLTGTAGNDTLHGLAGDDLIIGLGAGAFEGHPAGLDAVAVLTNQP